MFQCELYLFVDYLCFLKRSIFTSCCCICIFVTLLCGIVYFYFFLFFFFLFSLFFFLLFWFIFLLLFLHSTLQRNTYFHNIVFFPLSMEAQEEGKGIEIRGNILNYNYLWFLNINSCKPFAGFT